MSFIAYYAETFNSLDTQTSHFLGTLYVCLLISIFQLGFYVYKRSQFTHIYLMQILHFNNSVCLFLCCFSFFFFFYKIQIKNVEQVSCRYNFDCHYTDHLLSIKTLYTYYPCTLQHISNVCTLSIFVISRKLEVHPITLVVKNLFRNVTLQISNFNSVSFPHLV